MIQNITLGDREIVLVGTAHVSQNSVDEVRDQIESVEPDHVCIEIDEQRFRSIKEKQDFSRLDIFQIIKTRQAFLMLSSLVLTSFQRRMGLATGVQPGAELLAAATFCEEREIPVSLADRQVQTTLRRAWAKTGFWGKNKLLAALLSSAFSREELSEEDLDRLKEKNELEEMMSELADYLPSVKSVLIDERDHYLAQNIFDAPGSRIVAVVGAGHVPGIIRRLEALQGGAPPADLKELDSIPPPGPVKKALPYLIPAVVGGLIIWGFFRGGMEGGLQSLWRWILVNGTLSAIGAAVAFAHPLTIIASFLAAPITSMNPTIGVGFVTGLLEALFRKPRVQDFESLNQDILSFRGFFRNRLTHILLVFFFSSIGSSIGTFIAIPLLFS